MLTVLGVLAAAMADGPNGLHIETDQTTRDKGVGYLLSLHSITGFELRCSLTQCLAVALAEE